MSKKKVTKFPKITKAVVAVAGSGTRLLPATKAMPKEMLPIVDKPIVQLVAEELVEAGIKDIIFVTRWDKKPLEDHFDKSWALEHDLEKAGKKDYLREVKRISEMANFIYVRQKGPYGNGTPVLSAASLVDDEPFVFCFGDDLVKSKVSFTKQMVQAYERTGHLMVGVQKVPKKVVDRYGIVKLRGKTMQLEDIIEKPSVAKSPSQYAAFGRYILNQDVIDLLKKTKLGKGNELWLVDAIKAYIEKGGVVEAKKIEHGEWLTTGDPLNYLKAFMMHSVDYPELKKFIKSFKV